MQCDRPDSRRHGVGYGALALLMQNMVLLHCNLQSASLRAFPDACLLACSPLRVCLVQVKYGLKDVGYLYVNSDDCWMSFNRSSDGSQVRPRILFVAATTEHFTTHTRTV